jgi:prepilin signal peptidase PulO-like enzyme (type II secretory pathway)
MFFEVVWWTALGLILGSFANVLILRQGSQSLLGRSACPHCGKTLTWFELFPVISWLVLGAKCRTCNAPISAQYPLVELLMAVLTLVIGLSPAPLVVRSIGIGIALLLLAIAVYDLRHMIIPDVWAYALAALAFIAALIMNPLPEGISVLLFLASGPLTALPLFGLWLVSKGRWMGLGDAKLTLSFGWLVGLLPGYMALCIAFVGGAFVGVCVLLPLQHIVQMVKRGRITRLSTEGRGFTMKSEVPFGPFLILALCVVWINSLYNVDIPSIILGALVLSS